VNSLFPGSSGCMAIGLLCSISALRVLYRMSITTLYILKSTNREVPAPYHGDLIPFVDDCVC
jgi:hypothetical protein